ncbi:MAG: hypothetical protein OEO77_01360 [Acidimicrobiia bacterium]|nr:hypothetical protein [Acidimicrobiia bacterium]
MGRHRNRFARRVVALALILTACTATRAATGVVTAVDGDLIEVRSFTMQTTDGDSLVLVPAEDGSFAFPLPHLREHLRAGDPVYVEWEEVDGTLVATVVDDG